MENNRQINHCWDKFIPSRWWEDLEKIYCPYWTQYYNSRQICCTHPDKGRQAPFPNPWECPLPDAPKIVSWDNNLPTQPGWYVCRPKPEWKDQYPYGKLVYIHQDDLKVGLEKTIVGYPERWQWLKLPE
ncbi:MAG: hypothetical protein HQK55_07960 [Deltaproteobacteria bacterium]|nr:hypothetical protein [Deltaproteobacteria bacterium]